MVTVHQLLEFEVAFPGEKPLTVEEYLNGASKSIILNSAAFFLSFDPIKSKFDDPREFLGMYFSKENNGLANEIYIKIQHIESKLGRQVDIINTYNSLKLFEMYIDVEESAMLQSSAEFELKLFKAYLVLNSQYVEKQKVAFISTERINRDLLLPIRSFCMHYPVADKENYDLRNVWISQIIKSIYLFKFFESDAQCQSLLQSFLKHFDCEIWQAYLKSYIPLTMPKTNSEREAHTDIYVEQNADYESACTFLDKLSIVTIDPNDASDFLTLRAKPIYKVADGQYRLIYDLFVVEKIFKGLYFFLRDLNNKLPPEERKIADLKSFFGTEIAEHVLLYNAVDSIYPNTCIKLSGKHLLASGLEAEPDYYIRVDANILLFETKDFLIRADRKMSFDYNIYEQFFSESLYQKTDKKGTPKAIMQLIGNIKRVLKLGIKEDTNYEPTAISVYPILITQDIQYEAPGFNFWLDQWFQTELKKVEDEDYDISPIHPLTVICIDDLFFYQMAFLQDIPLHDAISLYRTHIGELVSRGEIMSSTVPFSIFISNYFKDKGILKTPSVFEELQNYLFE